MMVASGFEEVDNGELWVEYGSVLLMKGALRVEGGDGFAALLSVFNPSEQYT